MTPTDSPPATTPRRSWKKFGGSFLFVSVALHIVFGLVATVFIVQRIQAKRQLAFQGGPPSPSRSQRAVEHKVQVAKQKQTASAPAPPKRVAVAGLARVSLPEMPTVPTPTALVSPKLGGMGGMTGFGPGTLGGSAGGGGGGGGKGMNLFGMSSGGGLEGTFYDFKMQPGYQPIPGMNTGAYAKVVHDTASLFSPWRVDPKYPHYTSPAKLVSRYFMFPAIQDTEAAKSFQSPRSGPGCWLAHYRGKFSSTVEGTFRFVGFGDNVMMVKVGERVVLDASDHGYTGMKREGAGNISFPSKNATPLFFGQWFTMSPGNPQTIEVLVGDEGGIFCSGLFVQAKDTPYAQGDRGIPKLPIFALGTLTDADRQLLGNTLPPECLQASTFKAEAVLRSALDR